MADSNDMEISDEDGEIHDGLEDGEICMVEPMPKSLTPFQLKLKAQLEFYFGDDNYSKDEYLKELEDNDGWIDRK